MMSDLISFVTHRHERSHEDQQDHRMLCALAELNLHGLLDNVEEVEVWGEHVVLAARRVVDRDPEKRGKVAAGGGSLGGVAGGGSLCRLPVSHVLMRYVFLKKMVLISEDRFPYHRASGGRLIPHLHRILSKLYVFSVIPLTTAHCIKVKGVNNL